MPEAHADVTPIQHSLGGDRELTGMRTVIGALVVALGQQEFKLPVTVQLVCRQCLEADGLRVRPRDVNFLVRGMQMNGHVFGRGADDEPTLTRRLSDQILFLCEREQKVLNPIESAHLETWIKPKTVGPAA